MTEDMVDRCERKVSLAKGAMYGWAIPNRRVDLFTNIVPDYMAELSYWLYIQERLK